MATIADYLLRLNQDKALIKKAIEYNNQPVPSGTLFKDYANYIENIDFLNRGLVAHFPLNTNYDSIGELYQGTSSGSPILKGDHTSLNGSTDYITLGSILTTSNNTFSVSCWAKGSSFLSSNNNDFLFSSGSGLSEFQTGGGGTDYVRIMGNGWYRQATNDALGLVDTEKYYHIVLNVIEGTPHLYIDGVDKESSLSTSYSNPPSQGNFTIGTRPGSSYYWNGGVSNLRIYSIPASTELVQALYQEGYHPRSLSNIEDGLIHHWPLRGSAIDYVGTAHGTENTTTTYGLDSKRGVYCNCSTETSAIAVNSVDVDTSFTFSAWIYKTSTSTYDYILDTSSTGGRFVFGASQSLSNRILSIYDNGGWHSSGYSLALNTWHHVVLTLNSNDLNIYVDGKHVWNYTTSYIWTLDTNVALFGSYSLASSMIGYGNNARIYNRTLSANDIQKLYLREKHIRPIAVDDGLQFYLPLRTSAEDHTENQSSTTNVGTVSYNGQYATFDGDNDYISTGYIQTGNLLSYSAWVKCNSAGDWDIIMGNYKQYANGMDGLIFRKTSSDEIQVTYGANAWNDYYWKSSAAYASGMLTGFIHVGFALNTQTQGFAMYINGEAVSTTFSSSYTPKAETLTTNELFVANAEGNTASTRTWNGSLGCIRYYNRIVSPDEFRIIYESEKGDFQ